MNDLNKMKEIDSMNQEINDMEKYSVLERNFPIHGGIIEW
jgi:hypothetical protein